MDYDDRVSQWIIQHVDDAVPRPSCVEIMKLGITELGQAERDRERLPSGLFNALKCNSNADRADLLARFIYALGELDRQTVDCVIRDLPQELKPQTPFDPSKQSLKFQLHQALVKVCIGLRDKPDEQRKLINYCSHINRLSASNYQTLPSLIIKLLEKDFINEEDQKVLAQGLVAVNNYNCFHVIQKYRKDNGLPSMDLEEIKTQVDLQLQDNSTYLLGDSEETGQLYRPCLNPRIADEESAEILNDVNHNECIDISYNHYGVLCDTLKLHSAEWRNIGQCLGFLPGELDIIQAAPLLLQTAPVSWMNALLEKFLRGDYSQSTGMGMASLSQLETALSNAGLGVTASQLREKIRRQQGRAMCVQPATPSLINQSDPELNRTAQTQPENTLTELHSATANEEDSNTEQGFTYCYKSKYKRCLQLLCINLCSACFFFCLFAISFSFFCVLLFDYFSPEDIQSKVNTPYTRKYYENFVVAIAEVNHYYTKEVAVNRSNNDMHKIFLYRFETRCNGLPLEPEGMLFNEMGTNLSDLNGRVMYLLQGSNIDLEICSNNFTPSTNTDSTFLQLLLFDELEPLAEEPYDHVNFTSNLSTSCIQYHKKIQRRWYYILLFFMYPIAKSDLLSNYNYTLVVEGPSINLTSPFSKQELTIPYTTTFPATNMNSSNFSCIIAEIKPLYANKHSRLGELYLTFKPSTVTTYYYQLYLYFAIGELMGSVIALIVLIISCYLTIKHCRAIRSKYTRLHTTTSNHV